MRALFALFALALAALAVLAGSAQAAQELPAAIARSIDEAAANGQRRAADATAPRTGNPWLEAAVIEALAERPDLAGPVLERAIAADPGAREELLAEVVGFFPGLAATALRGAGPAPSILAPAAPEGEERAAATAAVAPRKVIPGVPAPEERPANWPILPEEGGADGYAEIDPLRPLNTVFFYLNGTLDFFIFDPIARVYRFLMPDAAKPHVAQAFGNLSSPIVLGNDLLQLEFERAGETLGRFLVNSTFGLAGLFDVASEWGLPPHRADFGQTLYRWGVGEGIYVVLPFFGSSNLRDGVGLAVDSFMDPKNYLLDSFDLIMLGLGEGIVRREELLDATDFIADYAENHYLAVRAWSWQQRQRELAEGCVESVRRGVCPAAP